jgi:hypothetical protein
MNTRIKSARLPSGETRSDPDQDLFGQRRVNQQSIDAELRHDAKPTWHGGAVRKPHEMDGGGRFRAADPARVP